MKRYINYARYVLWHKWFVLIECFKEGLIWRGLVHDLDKFRRDEFVPYALFFYNKDGGKRQIRDKTGYYKPEDTGCVYFDNAWFLHQKRNDHHWQWWIQVCDEGKLKARVMSVNALTEMICDWKGAALAQGVKSGDINEWWLRNRTKMLFNSHTRAVINGYLKTEEKP